MQGLLFSSSVTLPGLPALQASGGGVCAGGAARTASGRSPWQPSKARASNGLTVSTLLIKSWLPTTETTDSAGEWGGFAREGSADRAWQGRLAAFLCERGLTNNFYRFLKPNSGDTVPALSHIPCT